MRMRRVGPRKRLCYCRPVPCRTRVLTLEEIVMFKNIGLLLAGAMGLFVLEACIVVNPVDCAATPTDPTCLGNGGSAGNGGEGVAGKGGAGGTAGKGGAGGAGGAACEDTCIAAVSLEVAACAGSKGEPFYTALAECTCKTAAPDGCAADCGDNRCMGMTSSAACDDCIQKGACMNALADCTAN